MFWGGVISYDDAAKRSLLGVSGATLARHGAVSREVALAMARGVREHARTTWSVAVTGIAGPTGGSPEKPVGTVWIALDGPVAAARRYQFAGGRREVRQAAVEAAMEWLESCVSSTEEPSNGSSADDEAVE